MKFVFNQYIKRMYIDNHKRDDVITYQKEFFKIIF